MELDETTLLHEPDLMLAVLRVAKAGAGTLEDCLEHLRQLRRYAQVDEPMPEAEVRAGLRTVQAKLRRAGLIEVDPSGRNRITARGRQVLEDNPGGVDDTVLMQLAPPRPVNGLRAAINGHRAAVGSSQRASSIDYRTGYGAYLAGASLLENPHPPDVRAYLDWENGWSQARDDDVR